MRWPFWSSNDDNERAQPSSAPSSTPQGSSTSISEQLRDEIKSKSKEAAEALHNFGSGSSSTSDRPILSNLSDPSVVIATVALTALIFTGQRVYKSYVRRIPSTLYIPSSFLHKRSLLGRVTSVGDGDGFRLYHTPGGALLGWGWLRRIPTSRSALKANTISVRLAGVDAPEAAHFGKPGQPGGQEAWDWLRAYLAGERVRVKVWRRDQYERVVGTAVRLRWAGLVRHDVGYQMLRRGLATVYDAKTGVEFGGLEAKYRAAEARAKWWRRGIWAERSAETPREFKDRMKQGEGGS